MIEVSQYSESIQDRKCFSFLNQLRCDLFNVNREKISSHDQILEEPNMVYIHPSLGLRTLNAEVGS
ncbi:hypothetical protein BCY86_04945 [Pajaroellobacter abortibovis]|uniref:Uncharacterized protein n=1 Tax=Pajaroellobacter abortibovis TaxID=1882918 RepID=A0A1L6MXH1_9BACT|nr:hypothetical protein BCY86_04945 [Pajaroellobacter abortibovis]